MAAKKKKTTVKKAAAKKTPAKKAAARKAPVRKQAAAKKTVGKVAKKQAPQKKKATARRPVAGKATRKASPAPRSNDELLEALSTATRLSTDEVLSRALAAFASAHGLSLSVATAAEPEPLPLPAPSTRALPPPAEQADETPALGPDVRLYVHPPGRAPTEMIRDTFVIGSDQKCDLWLNYPKLENRHLRLVREGNRYYAEDMNTEAGSVVHGEPVTRYEIQHSDDIYLAGFLRVRFYLVS